MVSESYNTLSESLVYL